MPKNESLILRYHTRFEAILIFLTTVFILVFPKGGIKIGGVPLTWGYALIFGLGLVFLLANFSHGINISRKRWLVILAAIPFQAYLIMLIFLNGFVSIGFTISFVTSIIFLPWILVVFFGNYFDEFNPRFMLNLIRHGIFIVAAYGIFLFFYRAFSGHWIEIPMLTVNLADLGQLDSKFNMRFGFLPKLISTYNNGNIFGVCMIMMLPIFDRLENSRWKSAVVKLALILSLSRTVWIGLFLYEFVFRLYLQKITPKLIARYLILLAIMIAAVIVLVFVVLGQGTNFLFDTNLGGRTEQFESVENISLLSNIPFISIAEVVYLSILGRMGLVGLLLFLVMLAMPFILSIYTNGALRRSFIVGAALYLIVALSDGAIMFIPVMAFFWFVVSIMVSDNEFFDRTEIPDVSGKTEVSTG